MDSQAKCRGGWKALDSVITSGHVHHQRRAGKDSEAVCEKNAVRYPAAHTKIIGIHDQSFFFHCATRLTIRGIFPPGKINGSAAISAVTRMDPPNRCCSS